LAENGNFLVNLRIYYQFIEQPLFLRKYFVDEKKNPVILFTQNSPKRLDR